MGGRSRGDTAIRHVTRFDTSACRARMAAEIDLKIEEYIDRRQLKRLDRFAELALLQPTWLSPMPGLQ